MRKLLLIAVAAALPLAAAGCGEKPTVTVYKQGMYQGKPDTRPWDSDQSSTSLQNQWQKGDKVAWEKAIKARNLGQNEYVRGAQTAN
ncbi:MAG: hypothetical protein A3G24_22625 [Betaproteobacteria bacterium RIFCSPLOWO2_12_FULL_62_13]|nr:MAG: hypothetical protein A3G24_22625 [Betaproteobacteria bacterium RIFCSPLOWO2_12_FULL_62_13]